MRNTQPNPVLNSNDKCRPESDGHSEAQADGGGHRPRPFKKQFRFLRMKNQSRHFLLFGAKQTIWVLMDAPPSVSANLGDLKVRCYACKIEKRSAFWLHHSSLLTFIDLLTAPLGCDQGHP